MNIKADFPFIFLISKHNSLKEEAEEPQRIQGIYKATKAKQAKSQKTNHPLIGGKPLQEIYKGKRLLYHIQFSLTPEIYIQKNI